ncbi:MAG: transglycosylase domain-containing protein [Clostridia bacterium]|nr:transglycosylase domain-containing protein [Clostridia bacterium]
MFDNLWRQIRRLGRRFKRFCRTLFAGSARRDEIEKKGVEQRRVPTVKERDEIYDTRVHAMQVRRVQPRMSEEELGNTKSFVPVAQRGAYARPAEHHPRHDVRADASEEKLFVHRTERLRPFPLAVLFTTLKVMTVAVLLVGFAALGIGLGIAKAYVETTPELDTALLTKSARTSYIYDMNGELVTTFAGMQYRDWANIEEIPDMLKNAVIAVEDVRFYKHEGVDYKRLFSAVINTLRNTDTHGGSTITQQLIKNKILTSEQTYKRKIQEAYLALELETLEDKDAILEAYLNDVFLGGSTYGMKTAAKDYFGKDLADLSIRECAMLAGMVQKPYYTNPRANLYQRNLTDNYREQLEAYYAEGTLTEAQYRDSLENDHRLFVTDRRTNVVLLAMYNNGYITREQYDYALNDTVTIIEKSELKQMYDAPHFVEYAVRDVVTHLLEKRGLLDTNANRTAIENELRTGGYHIYTTLDLDIQNTVQDTVTNWDSYPSLADPSAAVKVTTGADGSPIEVIQPQVSAVVFDYHTGELRAIIGSRHVPTLKTEWNRAYQSSLPVGSSIKPLAVYGPALDLGASPATIIANFPGDIEGYGGNGYPAIGDEDFIGPTSIRVGVRESLNVVAARTLFEKVTPEQSWDYLVNLGVDPSRINMDGPGLALGTSGITTIEMAAAYGAIAAGGEYQEPLSFTRVVDSYGNEILSADEVRETRRVFQKSTAYLLVDMLTEAVQSGTGTRAKISGMTVAGKTGTNSDYGSVYFAGITPYYSATLWIGHDNYSEKLKSGSTGGRYAAPLWQAFMSEVHEGLEDRPIIDESPESLGLIKATVCSVSGLLATDACRLDPCGHTPITDWFTEGSLPEDECDMHVAVPICTASNRQAATSCATAGIKQGAVVLINSSSVYRQFAEEDVLAAIPNAIFTDIPAAQYGTTYYDPSGLCTLHGYMGGFGQAFDERASALTAAQQLLGEINSYLLTSFNLSELDRGTLSGLVNSLNSQMMLGTSESIMEAVTAAQATFQAITGQSGTTQQPTPEGDSGLLPQTPSTETPNAG